MRSLGAAMFDPLFLSLSTIVSVTALAMGCYVLFRNPHLGIARAFFLVMMLLSATSALDYLFLASPSYGQAMLMLRLLVFGVVCLFGGFLYLATFFALQSDCAIFARHWVRYMALVILSAAIAAVFFSKAEMGTYGWFVPNSPEMLGTGLIMLMYLGYSLHILNSAHRVSQDPDKGRMMAGLTLAMAVPFAYPLMISVMEIFGASFPSPLAPAYLVTSVVFFYAIVRERLFDLMPSDDFPRVAMKGSPDQAGEWAVLWRRGEGDGHLVPHIRLGAQCRKERPDHIPASSGTDPGGVRTAEYPHDMAGPTAGQGRGLASEPSLAGTNGESVS